MAESDSTHPLAGKVAEIDAIIPSPSERAERVWQIIRSEVHGLTTWDTICFAVEALGFLSVEYNWLLESAKRLNVLVYKTHYLFPHLVDTSSGIQPERFKRSDSNTPSLDRQVGQQAVGESQADSDRSIPPRDGIGRGFIDTQAGL